MTKDEALQLAHEGIEIHSPDDNEYKVCAALIEALEKKDEQWGSSSITNPEFVAEQKEKTQQLRNMVDAQNMASKSTYKEQVETKDEFEQTIGNILIDSYKAMQSMKVEGTLHVVCQCDRCKTQIETKDEPVAWGMEKDGVILDVICPDEHEREEGEYTIPLYTTPQRTWVGLTDREIEQEQWLNGDGSMTDFARAIEAKLKEKNE